MKKSIKLNGYTTTGFSVTIKPASDTGVFVTVDDGEGHRKTRHVTGTQIAQYLSDREHHGGDYYSWLERW